MGQMVLKQWSYGTNWMKKRKGSIYIYIYTFVKKIDVCFDQFYCFLRKDRCNKARNDNQPFSSGSGKIVDPKQTK